MKKIIFFLALIAAICPSAFGATYYVSNSSGSDSYTATQAQNPLTPWKTLSKVSTRSFSPGDVILFKRGDLWREKLIITSSGSLGNPITYSAYGSGNEPEINGADIISGWSVYSGNIYMANVPAAVSQFFADGTKQLYSRWPNSGWQTIGSNSVNNTSLNSSSLVQPAGYWTNASVVIRSAAWTIESKIITASSSGSIEWAGAASNPIKKDYGFYIEGKLEEVDSPGEWFYGGGKVYYYAAPGFNPAAHLMEATVRDNGVQFNSGKQHVVIANLSVKNTTTNGIYVNNSSFVRIEDNKISNSNGRGINAMSSPAYSRTDISISGNVVSKSTGDGIRVSTFLNGSISNNVVTDVAMDSISPKKAYGLIIYGKNLTVSANKISRVSFDGIFLGTADTVMVSDNEVSDCVMLLNDGGGIYTAGSHSGLVFKNNFVYGMKGDVSGTPEANSWAVGIYLDESASGVRVEGNLVLRSDAYGIKLHKAFNNVLVNNVVYDCKISSVKLEEKAQNQMFNNNFYNNIFFAADSSQLTFYATGLNTSSVAMGNFNHNIHYRAGGNTLNTFRYKRGTTPDTYYTLAGWQSALHQDSASLATDPLFVNTSGLLSETTDFILSCNSPAINSGKPAGVVSDFFSNPIYGIPDAGIYEHQEDPCQDQDAAQTSLLLKQEAEEALQKSKAGITAVYPNPVSGTEINLSIGDVSEDLQVNLVSSTGALIKSVIIKSGTVGSYKISLSQRLPGGLYVLCVKGKSYVQNFKLVFPD